jgi:hypothetical protein
MNENGMVDCSKCEGTGIDPKTEQICSKCIGKKQLDWITNITGEGITRQGKAILFTIKTLNKFVSMGLMEGGAFEISSEAEECIKDFKPTNEELELSVLMLKQEGYIK